MASSGCDEHAEDIGEVGVIDESVTGWYRGCLLVSLAVRAAADPAAAAALFAAARVAAVEHRCALVVDLQSPGPDAPPLTVAAAERAMACAYIAANEGLASLRSSTTSSTATTAPATSAQQPDIIVLPPVPRSRRAAPASYVPAGATVDLTRDTPAAYTTQHAAHAPPPALLAAIVESCTRRCSKGTSSSSSSSSDGTGESEPVERAAVDVMCVGGTFDRLHAGHRHMLALCVLLARAALHVGVTAVALLRSKAHRELIQDYGVRRAQLLRTLWLMHPRLAYCFEPLTDPAGPAQRLARIQAIVVSAETVRGAAYINARRAERAMAPLRVFVVGFIPPPSGIAADALGKLSSSSLRAVEHDAAAAASCK